MIDICTVIHRNYDLFNLQLKNWSWLEGEKRVLFCDNTPQPERRPMFPNKAYTVPHEWVPYSTGSHGMHDGESHGSTLDCLVRATKTPIIGILDSDFFWLKKDILADVQELFAQGMKCVGVENWYNDFELVNQRFPERASYLAPSVFGMFIDRELAQDTFVATRSEGHEFMAEVGWRIRSKIIKEKIPHHTYLHYQTEDQPDPAVCYFGTPKTPVGIHFLKSSNPGFGRNVKKMFKDFKLDQLFLPQIEDTPLEPILADVSIKRQRKIESMFSP